MGKVFDHIPPELYDFIVGQRMFWVATAPLARLGHVNLSPKGLDCLRVIDERRVAYLDLTGSGNETSAHVEENGRITFMFCAFEGPPRILRLYGRGRTVLAGDPAWDALLSRFEPLPGIRQIIAADIDRVSTSCGFGVPLYEFRGQRDHLPKHALAKGEAGLEQARRKRNVTSIDGLPTALGRTGDTSSEPRRSTP